MPRNGMPLGNLERYLTVAHTMTLTIMGQSFMNTPEPQNVKASLAASFDDLYTGPRIKALGRPLGSGIFTTDGQR